MNRFKMFLGICMLPLLLGAQTTLEECQQAARANYPLIKKYDLISRTTDYTVSNIGKGWLPQISATAQATYQSDVTAWPDELLNMFKQVYSGLDIQGLKKDQYRVGVDISQMVFDGGTIKNQKEIARLQGDVMTAQNDVDMYAVRKKVNELFFGILLLDEKIRMNEDLQVVLKSNEDKLTAMWNRGTASESDLSSVKAERLNVMQTYTELLSARQAMQRILTVFCGKEISALQIPAEDNVLDYSNNRPELNLIDRQLRLADAQGKMLNANLMPKLSVFAQGFYGYPGYNMFEDMMNHDWSWNGMIGARLSWNIGSLYTRKNDKAKLHVQRMQSENYRDVFLFNSNLDQIQQQANIDRYKKLMTDDDEIIRLRTVVREAAESKLRHGIIDVNALLQEINRENNAKVSRSTHQIEMLKEIYDLKYTTNN